MPPLVQLFSTNDIALPLAMSNGPWNKMHVSLRLDDKLFDAHKTHDAFATSVVLLSSIMTGTAPPLLLITFPNTIQTDALLNWDVESAHK